MVGIVWKFKVIRSLLVLFKAGSYFSNLPFNDYLLYRVFHLIILKMKQSEVPISRIAMNDIVPFTNKRSRTYRQNTAKTTQLQESSSQIVSNKKNIFVLKNMEYLNGLTPRKNLVKNEEKNDKNAKRYSHNQLNLMNKMYNNNYKEFPKRLLVKPRQHQSFNASKMYRLRRHSCEPSSGDLLLSKMLYLQFSD